ncbi:MAG: DUF2975 domain-containing protein [Spirosomataceae bacterium]
MMKQRSTVFLQVILVLIGIAALTILIRFPLTEGRAKNLDLFSIYMDPLILYGYAASTSFFIALYKAFKLLGYIGQNEVFSPKSVKTLASIRYCALLLSVLIIIAGLYISIFHDKNDDPAGFLAICIVATFFSVVVAIAFMVFENIFQNGLDLQVENERLSKR